MSPSSSTLILVGIGAAILIALLLMGGAGNGVPQTETAAALTAPIGQESQTTFMTPAVRVDVGSDVTVREREAIQLTATVFGVTEDSVSFRWAAVGALGSFSDPTAKEPVYTAPSACDCEDSVVLTLTVTDAYAVSANDSLVLTVYDPAACPRDPCVHDPVCLPIDICPVLSEEVCPPKPDVACETPCIEDPPTADPCGEIVVPCPCVGGDCGSTWMSSWPFEPTAGLPGDRPKPRIVRQFPAHISEGALFRFSGMISNPACIPGCFVWAASKGILEGADTLSPTFHAPQTDRAGGERVTISLILYDGNGGRSYDQVRLTIDNLDYDGPAVP
jgi:hypothetical protein